MPWQAGDLGRFRSESPKRPRFEVIRPHKGQGIEVWYSGSPRTTIIPTDTFREDCVNWWEHAIIRDQPEWIQVGAVLGLGRHHEGGQWVLQAEIKRRHGKGADKEYLDTRGHTLIVRNIRRDYVSCLMQPKGFLILVSLHHIMQHGYRSRTIWDRLNDDDDPYEDEAELIRLLDDA